MTMKTLLLILLLFSFNAYGRSCSEASTKRHCRTCCETIIDCDKQIELGGAGAKIICMNFLLDMKESHDMGLQQCLLSCRTIQSDQVKQQCLDTYKKCCDHIVDSKMKDYKQYKKENCDKPYIKCMEGGK